MRNISDSLMFVCECRHIAIPVQNGTIGKSATLGNVCLG